jgi:VWFA-related protein
MKFSGICKAAAGVMAGAMMMTPGISQAPIAPASTAQPAEPVPVLNATTQMVTLEILARDRQGNHVPGLTAKDFQVFEEVAPKNDKRLQQIAFFQSVSAAAIAAAGQDSVPLPPGVFSNIVTMHKAPVAPTVLLIDGINTPLADQLQVHRQMVKVLGSIPADVPVAVFLLGRQLHMLQNFTTDPKLLIDASKKAVSGDAKGLAETDHRDDPDSMSALLEDVPAPGPGGAASGPGSGGTNSLASTSISVLHQFERENYSEQMDIRVQATLDALRSIARHLSGYGGRKNLLWISSSFPLQIAPDADNLFNGTRNYNDRMAEVAQALSDAKVAVYPMDPAGLQTESFFQASNRGRSNMANGTAAGNSIIRENQGRYSRQASMDQLAEGTGGRICVNNNDLSDCVKKAMDDGSSYYELAYYPDSTSWNGEFHRIVVKTSQPGVHLAYRHGYFAPNDAGGTEHIDDAKRASHDLRQVACDDLLTSTALLVFAKSIPADQPGKAKYFLAIDPKQLAFAPTDEGGRKLSMTIAVCTFGQKGNPLQYFTERSERKLGQKEYASLTALPHTVQFPLDPGVSRLRVVVQDSLSGVMGSVNIPYAATPPAQPSGNSSSPAVTP